MDRKRFQQTMETEKLTLGMINVLLKSISPDLRFLGVTHSNVDYTRGRGILGEHDRCIWLKDGRRVTISVSLRDGSTISQISTTADPNIPPPAYSTPAIPNHKSTDFDTLKSLLLGAIDKGLVLQGKHIQKCINPDCDNQVDITKKRSGACCKGCMSFECTHPDCLKKAEKMGWEKYTHRYGTKIAQKHLDYKKGE